MEKIRIAADYVRYQNQARWKFFVSLMIFVFFTPLGAAEEIHNPVARALIPAGVIIMLHSVFFLKQKLLKRINLKIHLVILYGYVVIFTGCIVEPLLRAYYSSGTAREDDFAGFIVPLGITIYLVFRQHKLVREFVLVEDSVEQVALEQFNIFFEYVQTNAATDPEVVTLKEDAGENKRKLLLKPYRGHMFFYSRDYKYLTFVPLNKISLVTSPEKLSRAHEKSAKAREKHLIPVAITIQEEKGISGFIPATGWDKLDSMLKTLGAHFPPDTPEEPPGNREETYGI